MVDNVNMSPSAQRSFSMKCGHLGKAGLLVSITNNLLYLFNKSENCLYFPIYRHFQHLLT